MLSPRWIIRCFRSSPYWLAALGDFVIPESRANLYEQKKADIRNVAEAVVSEIAGLDKRVSVGEMTREQAQAEAKKLMTASLPDMTMMLSCGTFAAT